MEVALIKKHISGEFIEGMGRWMVLGKRDGNSRKFVAVCSEFEEMEFERTSPVFPVNSICYC